MRPRLLEPNTAFKALRGRPFFLCVWGRGRLFFLCVWEGRLIRVLAKC